MLYAFDLDGTLITSYMDSPDKDFHSWQVLPGRRELIAALVAEGHEIAIVTNQAGVAFGYNTPGDVTTKLILVAQALGFVDMLIYDGSGEPRYHGFTRGGAGRVTAHVAYEHPKATIARYKEDPDAIVGHRRKPSGAMIHEAMAEFPAAAADGVLYVGDRLEDEGAARNAGVRFQWADQFFGGKHGR